MMPSWRYRHREMRRAGRRGVVGGMDLGSCYLGGNADAVDLPAPPLPPRPRRHHLHVRCRSRVRSGRTARAPWRSSPSTPMRRTRPGGSGCSTPWRPPGCSTWWRGGASSHAGRCPRPPRALVPGAGGRVRQRCCFSSCICRSVGTKRLFIVPKSNHYLLAKLP